ncbi:MAG: DoxX family protein [Muribaculaceae bacterium]|nr:DoxX family protein [Muribaculaceae bacterium]MDE6537350.1 DoxX family protein [Muribaculaceae bacterium]MDE6836588.1 DoxX family protein [Muribaculaceae bacterium]
MNPIKRLYIRTTGYSYTNMGRLFLRLFVGIMMLQFGLRQWADFDQALATFPEFLGIPSNVGLVLMMIVEIVCSIFIMFGFLTRLMCFFPMIAMTLAEIYLLSNADTSSYLLSWQQLGYLPVMFIGIYFFIILVGPGKISADYFLSLYIIHSNNHSESELEEV